MEDETQKRIEEWLNSPIDRASKDEILFLMEEDLPTLQDAFSQNLSFGTGGMRGIMGVGTNRLNRYTVQMATQGLASYLLKYSPSKAPTTFISYDSRHQSAEFALEAACVLAGNGIGVYLTKEMRPTPLVSFGVRQMGCLAGIMITASHNPKEYNGYKVYWRDGAQVVSPHDEGIVKEVSLISQFSQLKIAPATSPLIQWVGEDFDQEYLAAIYPYRLSLEENQAGEKLSITYTSLHGTGITLIPKALSMWGFTSLHIVPSQAAANGDFPTVKAPNPENPEALSIGIEQMKKEGSDLLIATDPDADRVAVGVKHKGKIERCNGNQIGAMCLEYICLSLQQKGKLSPHHAAVTTIVSTDLIKAIATHYQIRYVELLTGFKYIGEQIHRWEVEKSDSVFLFGIEESYGYLLGTHSRDKDGVIGSCLIAEMALYMKKLGKTLIDFLEEIYQKYGVYSEQQKTIEFSPNQKGMEQMQLTMDRLRSRCLKKIGNREVLTLEDYLKSTSTSPKTGQSTPLTLPKSNVLLFRLEGGGKLIVRPSGTEPKLKIYGGLRSAPFSGGNPSQIDGKTALEALLNALTATL